MKVALISDIHGNAVALKKVLVEIKDEGIKQVFIMGDFLGYYYDHDKVFKMLGKTKWQGVQGNHDRMLEVFFAGNENLMKKYRTAYGHSLDSALEVLSDKQMKMLLNLPATQELKVNGQKVLLCHGSPWNQSEYLYPDTNPETFERIFELGFNYVLLGHSHYPFVKKKDGQVIINAGSIGQPRDESAFSSWFVVDFKRKKIKLYRTRFPAELIIKKVKENDPDNPYLINVLRRKGHANKD